MSGRAGTLGISVEEQGQHRWGSSSPATHLGNPWWGKLEEAQGDAGRPLCGRDVSGEEENEKKKGNQCLFLLEKIALCALHVFSYY